MNRYLTSTVFVWLVVFLNVAIASECQDDVQSRSGHHDVVSRITRSGNIAIDGVVGEVELPNQKNREWKEWNENDWHEIYRAHDRIYELFQGTPTPDWVAEYNQSINVLKCFESLSAQYKNKDNSTSNTVSLDSKNSKNINKNNESKTNSKAQKKIDSEKVYASKESNLATEEANKQNNGGSKNKLPLITEAPCISVRNTKGGNVDNIFQWVIFHNSCAYDVRVRFCTELNCTQATQADVYHSGDSEKYPAPLHNKRWHIGVKSACKVTSGMSADGQGGQGEVYSDNNGSCFVYVK